MRSDSTWIQTFTGRQVWPLDPRVGDFEIRDIAHALSNICRYTGHCSKFYSVAQHSVHVAEYVASHDRTLALTALLHDASEAYLSDMARPIKHQFEQYLILEKRLEEVIAEQFGLVFPYPPVVKEADDILLNTERRDLMCNPPRPWQTYGVGYLDIEIVPWTPEVSERRFLEVYGAIVGAD